MIKPSYALWITVALSTSTLYGCKEDPPPPPTPDQPASSAKADPHHRPDRFGGAQVPKISPETMKAYRVETCYYGTLGLKLARDNYLASLGGAEPSADKLPSFGEFPSLTPAKTDKPAPAGSAMGAAGAASGSPVKVPGAAEAIGRQVAAGRSRLFTTGTLPFVRHIRSCSIAKTMKEPAYEGLDKQLAEFEAYINGLNKALLDTQRYYTRKQHEKDELKRGKELHKTLTEMFPELDAKLAAFAEAVAKWQPQQGEPKEELDEAGKLSNQAIADARALAALLLAESIDGAKVKELTDKLKERSDALGKLRDQKVPAPHARIVAPKLEQLLTVVDELGNAQKLDAEQLYKVSYTMAELLEAHHRGLSQLLRKRGDTHPAADARRVTPRLKAGVPFRRGGEPLARPKGDEAPAGEPAADEAGGE